MSRYQWVPHVFNTRTRAPRPPWTRFSSYGSSNKEPLLEALEMEQRFQAQD
jgi:hypothetical protein